MLCKLELFQKYYNELVINQPPSGKFNQFISESIGTLSKGTPIDNIEIHPEIHPETQNEIEGLISRGTLPEKYKKLVLSIPWGPDFTFIKYNEREMRIISNLKDGGKLDFTTKKDSLYINWMKSNATGKSNSLNILSNLIVGASSAGIKKIRTWALSGEDSTGYKTWPRMGFEWDSTEDMISSFGSMKSHESSDASWNEQLKEKIEIVSTQIKKALKNNNIPYKEKLEVLNIRLKELKEIFTLSKNATSLLSLTSTARGKMLWSKYGKEFSAIPVYFDLSPGSKSIRRFKALRDRVTSSS
jgi:hypothetical protein